MPRRALDLGVRRSLAAGGVLVVAGFLALLVGLALSRPLCCADDAGYAVVARNLAEGRGYRQTLAYSSQALAGKLFDPQIGTGPASIVPVAAAIALAGPRPALPGLVHVTQVSTLLVLAVIAAGGALEPARRAAVAALFAVLVLLSSAYHLEQWHALLGEVPAALCLILAAGLWARRPRRGRAVLAGAVCGVALLHKLVAVFGAVALPLSLLLPAESETPPARRARDGAAWLLGLLVPLLAFELWKWIALGSAGWLDHLRDTIDFLRHQGLGEPRAASLGTRLAERGAAVADRFALVPWIALLTLPLLARAQRHTRGPTRSVLRTLLLATVLQAGYWLFVSIGWPRYLYVGLVLWLFALALAIVATPGRALRGALVVATCAAFVPGLFRLRLPFDQLAAARRAGAGSELAAARRVAAAIAAEAPSAPVLTENFAQVATLEYLSDRPGRFRNFAASDLPTAPDQLLVVHDRFRFRRDAELAALLARCDQIALRAEPYALRRCR